MLSSGLHKYTITCTHIHAHTCVCANSYTHRGEKVRFLKIVPTLEQSTNFQILNHLQNTDFNSYGYEKSKR